MLGWMISTHRIDEPDLFAVIKDVATLLRLFPAKEEQAAIYAEIRHGKEIAVWQTGPRGLEWIDELACRSEALALPTNGYPNAYVVQARHVVPVLLAGPPQALLHWTLPKHYEAGPAWYGRTFVDRSAVEACEPHEWLLVEAWDES